MNYESYEVNGVTYFSYADAYCANRADCMWGLTVKGNWAVVHNRELGF